MSLAVTSFAKSFVWDAKNFILPTSLAIPAAVEIAVTADYVHSNFDSIKKKLSEINQRIVSSFTPEKNETSEAFAKRAIKNVLIVMAATSLLTLGATLPFVVLPSLLAMPAAVTTICLLGEAFINGRSHCDTLKKKVSAFKEWITDAFTKRTEESLQEFEKRRARNISIAIGVAVATTVAIVALSFGIHAIALHVAHVTAGGNLFPWGLIKLLPNQTPTVVFLEYALVGAMHGIMGLKKWLKGDKAGAIFHFISMGLSFAFPTYYFLDNPATMRLHHSFLGLLLQLAPFRALKIYGSMVTLDSALYILSPLRGYLAPWGFENFDLQNIVVNNISTYVNALSVLSGWNYCLDRLLPKNPT